MASRKNGVAGLLKRQVPWLISYHCANHRTALAAAHAANGIPYLRRFKDSLGQLYRFFDNSSVRLVNLQEIQVFKIRLFDSFYLCSNYTKWQINVQADIAAIFLDPVFFLFNRLVVRIPITYLASQIIMWKMQLIWHQLQNISDLT